MPQNDFIVREYAYISVDQGVDGGEQSTLNHAYVSQSAFDHLCELAGSFTKSGASLFELAGRKRLKLDQYVGVIETPCGTRLEILPKHIDVDEAPSHEQVGDCNCKDCIVQKERQLLINMLKVSLKLTPREAGGADLSRFRHPLHEWIMEQFLNALKHLIQRGLRFDYHRVEEEQKFLRGQLKHVKYMRQGPTKRHIFPIEHDIYDANRAENRLIKAALDIVCVKIKDSKSWSLAQELRLMTDEIPRSINIKNDFKQWQTGRLLASYEEIKPWCEIILNQFMPVSTRGDWRGMSLLFPMEKLFENYVGHYLKKQSLANNFILKTQSNTRFLVEHTLKGSERPKSLFKMKPDFLIQLKYANNTDVSFVLDAKWKLLNKYDADEKIQYKYGISQADMYQLFAYGHKYLSGKGHMMLIYPKYSKFAEPLPPFEFSDDLMLWVVPFCLDKCQLIFGDAHWKKNFPDDLTKNLGLRFCKVSNLSATKSA